MIERLQLRRPVFRRTAAYGHFGRSEPGFTWEQVDAASRRLLEVAGGRAAAV
jgi:S-adenosylmethionine synthetase